MYPDSNTIIDFIMQRWKLTKIEVASILGCSQYTLSRKDKPYRYDSNEVYRCFFEADPKGNKLSNEEKSDMLDKLVDYLLKAECKRAANLIHTKRKSGLGYKEIVLKTLDMALIQPEIQTPISNIEEEKILKVLEKRTISNDDIDALFLSGADGI